MFTAANPHAKSPAQIQECCLNPGLDTATSPPQQLQQWGRQQGQGHLGGGQGPEWGTSPGQVWGRRAAWGIVPLCSQQPGQSCGAHLTGTQRKSVGLGWPRAALGEAASSREPRGAGRGWEATAKLRGDPQWGHRAAADPVLTLGCPYTAPPSLGHTQASAPFPSLPFYRFSTHRCPQGPLGTATLTLPGAIAPHTLSPAPWSSRPPTSGLSSPERAPGGLSPAGSISGVAECGAGLQLCLKLRPPRLLRGGNHSPYQSVAILAERKRAEGSLRAPRGRRRPALPLSTPRPWGLPATHGMGEKGGGHIQSLLSLTSKELGASGEK